MHPARVALGFVSLAEISLIIDLFQHKSITHGVILNCIHDKSTILIKKILFDYNIKVCAQKINNDSVLSIPHYYQKIGIILNTSCPGWQGVLDMAEPLTHFKSPFSWVLLARDAGPARLRRRLPAYRLEADSDVTAVLGAGTEGSFHLYEMFHTGFGKNGQFISRRVGEWSGSLSMEDPHRMDLRGLELRAVVVINHNQRVVNETFVRYLSEARPGLHSVDPMHKFKYFEVLRYYRDLYNITYRFRRTASWGYPTNGSFDGMVGALQRREADIAGSPMFVRTDRAAAVDYAAETWQTRPCFIFLVPRHPGGVLAIYWRPLARQVWACAAGVAALAAALLAAALRRRPGGAGEGDASPALALLFVWSAVCQQGMALERRSPAVRIASLAVLAFALTLYQYYNATVVSTLLHEAPNAVRSVRALVRSDMRVGIEDVLYIKDFFKRTTDPVALELYQRKVVAGGQYNFYSPEAGLARVRRGGFAFHVDSAQAYRIMRRTFSERALCAAAELSLVVPQYLGAAVARRSAYREHVARALRRAAEAGLLHRLRGAWDAARPACARRAGGAGGVSAREVAVPLLALGAGAAAAPFVLLLERRRPPPAAPR